VGFAFTGTVVSETLVTVAAVLTEADTGAPFAGAEGIAPTSRWIHRMSCAEHGDSAQTTPDIANIRSTTTAN
jgi:hypothetical protein